MNFYDGTVRVVDPDGNELCRYRPEQHLEHIAEAAVAGANSLANSSGQIMCSLQGSTGV